MNLCILSKCLYICIYLFLSSVFNLSVFADVTPFSFLILLTNCFSWFLIYLSRQSSSTLTFWIRWFLVLGGCPVHCSMFRSISGPCLLHTLITSHFSLYFQSQYVPRESLGRGEQNCSVENHWPRSLAVSGLFEE